MAKSQKLPQDDQARKPIKRPEGWTYLKALRMLGECVLDTDFSKDSLDLKLDAEFCSYGFHGIISMLRNVDLQLPEDELKELIREIAQVSLKTYQSWPPEIVEFMNERYRCGLGFSEEEMVDSLNELLIEFTDPKDEWQVTPCICGCGHTQISNAAYREEIRKELRPRGGINMIAVSGGPPRVLS